MANLLQYLVSLFGDPSELGPKEEKEQDRREYQEQAENLRENGSGANSDFAYKLVVVGVHFDRFFVGALTGMVCCLSSVCSVVIRLSSGMEYQGSDSFLLWCINLSDTRSLA